MRRALALLLLTACSAQRIVYTPSEDERALLKQPPLDMSVAIVHWAGRTTGQIPYAYSSHLVELLKASNTFRTTTYDSTRRTHADLFATPTHDYCNTALLPFATILTLGIIPTIWNEEECTGVVFHSPRDSSDTGDSVIVRMHVGGKAMMGWLALPFGLVPGWSWHTGRNQQAYQQAFRLAILKHRDELLMLSGRAAKGSQ
jgi:hypothetical protein